MKLGLAAIDALCQRLGRAEEKFAPVLIGGTNGKGSTAAMLSAIAAASGLRAGLYTSPHLIDVTERIRVEERDISKDELNRVLERVFRSADAAPEIPVTYFEALTAAAFLAFAERGVELAVLEVGLGGRFDATNVAPARLSAITSVSLDHLEELGPTIESVAREKAGIFRRGQPALVWSEIPEALETLRAAACETGAVLHEVPSQTRVETEKTSLEGTRFRLRTPEGEYALWTPLPGNHQASNATLAVRAAELLAHDFPAIRREAIVAGLRSVRWPGRLERFRVCGRVVLLDGCHNPDGASSLARFLAESGLAGRAHLIFGAMADKDIEGIAARLFPLFRGVSLVSPASPRAATPSELARRVAPARSEVFVRESLEGTLHGLLADPAAETIIVAGSLYLVGEARALLLAGKLGTADS